MEMAVGKISVFSLILLACLVCMSTGVETPNQRLERIDKFFTQQEDKFHAELKLKLDRKAAALRHPERKSLVPTNQDDMDALQALYSSTGGKDWANSTGWMKGDPCGNPFWFGIYCRDGRVLQINLVDNGLTGKLPGDLSKASNLQVARFYSNELTGDIPPEIFTMKSLQIFDANTNQIGGSLPSEINMPNLTDLALYGNMIEGGFPEINSPVLSILEISSNGFTGPLPTLSSSRSPGLTQIVVSRNSFTGSLPSSWGVFSNLNMLWTFDNNLDNPTFPDSWSGMNSLVQIQADGMHGEMPNWFNNMNKMQVFVIINGWLTGGFPNSVCNSQSMTNFRIFNNSLTGQVPRCICDMRNVTDIELSDNQFTGPIPDCIGDMTNLANMYFSRNNFSGEFPESIGNLVNLETLDISQNDMYGTIPNSINNLRDEIADFAICYNKFSHIASGCEDFFNRIKNYGCAFYNNPWSCPLPSEVPKECDAMCSKCNSGPGQNNCGSCIKDSNCGWCSEGQNCLEGGASGPGDYYHCDPGRWVYGTTASC